VLQERNEYESARRKKEEAALLKLAKEEEARNLELGVLPPATAAPATGKAKRKKEATAMPGGDLVDQPSRAKKPKVWKEEPVYKEEPPDSPDAGAAEDDDDEAFRG